MPILHLQILTINAQNQLDNFPCKSRQLLADLLVTQAHSKLSCYAKMLPTSPQQVRNNLATSRCNRIWETTRHNRHNGLL